MRKNSAKKINQIFKKFVLLLTHTHTLNKLEASQRLYGSEATATLTAEYEQHIQRWEAENELIIQEVVNLLQATRPEGELHQNQEFIHHLNQHLGEDFNLSQLFSLMNGDDRERERERVNKNWENVRFFFIEKIIGKE